MKIKKKSLKPTIIEYKIPFDQLAEVSIENSVATLDRSNNFALLTINAEGIIEEEHIVAGFPGVAGTLRSDSEHNMLWIERGRGLYFLDIETRRTGHVVTNNDGNARILQSFLLDPEKKLFMISTISVDCAAIYYIYDLLNDEIRQVGVELATLFRFHDNSLLGSYTLEQGGSSRLEWDISDFELKKFGGPDNNKLTKELTKLQVDSWHKTKTMHLGRRMLLGSGWVGQNLIYYSAHWDEEMDEIKVEPLTVQLPRRATLHSDFTFSADGQWVQTLSTRKEGFPQMVELLIYHVGTVYPQGLSLPIYCGFTKDGNDGAFMQHSEWGPLYIERDQDMEEKLFIYKLHEGLEILKEQAVELTKK